MLARYRQHIQEAKHRAFMAWMDSGYRDLTQHAEFIRLFVMLASLPRR